MNEDLEEEATIYLKVLKEQNAWHAEGTERPMWLQPGRRGGRGRQEPCDMVSRLDLPLLTRGSHWRVLSWRRWFWLPYRECHLGEQGQRQGPH